MTPIEMILSKVRRIDIEAARYIEERYDQNNLWEDWKRHAYTQEAIGNLFSWNTAPQGYTYWYEIHCKYIRLPLITPKGNEL